MLADPWAETRFDCFFIAIILAPSSTTGNGNLTTDPRTIVPLCSYVSISCPVSLSLLRLATRWSRARAGSWWVRSECTFSAAFHREKKTDRYLLHNCILRNVTVIESVDHRFVSIGTPPQNLERTRTVARLSHSFSFFHLRIRSLVVAFCNNRVARLREKEIFGCTRADWPPREAKRCT